MSTLEYRIYQFYSIISVALYPTLQFALEYGISDKADAALYSVIGPQILYSAECLFVAFLLQVTNYRLRGLLGQSGPRTQDQINFYIRMNHLISGALVMDFIGLFAINADICTEDREIYSSKLATDMFTKVFNTGFTATYPLVTYALMKQFNNKSARTHASGVSRSMYGENPSRISALRPTQTQITHAGSSQSVRVASLPNSTGNDKPGSKSFIVSPPPKHGLASRSSAGNGGHRSPLSPIVVSPPRPSSPSGSGSASNRGSGEKSPGSVRFVSVVVSPQ